MVELTKDDYAAIKRGDFGYLNDKGAYLYGYYKYEDAIEYYRLAAAMGCVASISNLGYCYMYARSIPQNISIAIGYFELAAKRNDPEAIYKLGNMYEVGKYVKKDMKTAMKYYSRAVKIIEKRNYPKEGFPSLFLCYGRQFMPGGLKEENKLIAHEYLQYALKGYDEYLERGCAFYQDSRDTVVELLKDKFFEGM